jgi:hypothetical protein
VYELEPFANVLKAARAKLTNENGNKGNVLQLVLRRKKLAPSDRRFATEMVLNGTMWQKDGLFLAEPPMIEEESNVIWLPNSLVTGTHRKEASPIKRLRSSCSRRGIKR